MRKAKWLLVGLVAVALVQLVVPASMIVRRERCLREGRAFKFLTRPLDPYDPFRGRYVTLSPAAAAVPVAAPENAQRGETLHAWVTVGSDGYATFSRLTRERPDDTPHVDVRMRWSRDTQTTVRLPFDRFYMDETDAPEAERIYAQHARETNSFVVVRVLDGLAVIEDLYVAGRPIREVLKEQAP
jgi:uncharacterized membrane-anchored protein